MKIALALVSALTATLTTAQQSVCRSFGYLQWQCDVCGSALYNSGPIGCVPFNATFDSLSPSTQTYPGSPLSSSNFTYSSAKWTNFTTIKPASLSAKVVPPQLQPHSKFNYARLARAETGRKGVIAFANEGGEGGNGGGSGLLGLANLWSFWYGCTEGKRENVPTPCTITVASSCIPVSNLSETTNLSTFTYNLAYTPSISSTTGYANTSMAFYKGDPATDARYVCYNYTLSAKGSKSAAVDLVVDDVWYRALRHR